jgi:hypothetical protein
VPADGNSASGGERGRHSGRLAHCGGRRSYRPHRRGRRPCPGRYTAPLLPVLRIRIRIRRIHMVLDLPDPHPDLLVIDMNPDPSIIKQK